MLRWRRRLRGVSLLSETILWYLQQKMAADWLSKSNRFQAFPPCLKNLEEEEVFKQ